MIDFLLGVPGKLKAISDHLTTYWTSTRAAKLDYLTANVAVASTALSNADYTSARAAKLDGIIQTTVINSIQVGTISAAGTAGSGIDYTYKDIAITAVVINKCVVIVNGNIFTGTAGPLLGVVAGRLTSTTNLRLSGSIYQSGAYIGAAWQVVEFK